ncbi:alpha/beta hydrolase [Blastopirellula sp. JC732]|uniref:Alpha/beta hydrolase n=1 Tax=Blastopirellula sediminis TaxID=2894196 RepID=A0A9X1MJX4_9BACT|nr:alpha/beta hydrolase [Blastopirellula sediminis]MCC9608730.1 alpha/beta hydrolase [Blastopirellula sediminis]MCC9628493.1 alpha/beta hydrolase [Blastopirellula sediminis]
MEPVPVKTSSKLRVTYSLHLAESASRSQVVVLHHGILHTRATFLDLIAALNQLGIHAVMIEQQSQDAGFWRNCIGMGAYAEGMKDALVAIRTALAASEEPLQIGIVAVHSMGGEIWEETREKYPELRRPTVMMAPIPQNGALRTSLRLLRDYPFAFLKAALTFSVLSLAKTPEQVKRLFFHETANMEVVRRTTSQLTHSPFWSYLQLTFRWLLRPKISRQDMPQLLLYSESDYIFQPWEFDKTRKLYGDLLDEQAMLGGHDFFIGDARPTAAAIQEFFEKHKKVRTDDIHQ